MFDAKFVCNAVFPLCANKAFTIRHSKHERHALVPMTTIFCMCVCVYGSETNAATMTNLNFQRHY